MTEADIIRRIEFMRSLDREFVNLPIVTVEKLMATGHKIRVGKGSTKGGRFKPKQSPPIFKRAKEEKANRMIKRLTKNVEKAKGKA